MDISNEDRERRFLEGSISLPEGYDAVGMIQGQMGQNFIYVTGPDRPAMYWDAYAPATPSWRPLIPRIEQ